MLCPKCGYITFDKLSDCPKCKKSWGSETEKISGTSSTVEKPCFLGRVLKEPDAPESQQEDDSKASDSISAEDTSDQAGIEFGGDEGDVASLDELSEEGDLDVALDELNEIDLAGEDTDAGPELSEGIDFSINTDDSQLSMSSTEEDRAQKGTTVDLNEIDLSGLVSDEETEVVDLSMAEENTDEVDLNIPGPGDVQKETVSPVVDLNLDDDEDMLDLSLDLESDGLGPDTKKDDPVIPDLGLSLDKDD